MDFGEISSYLLPKEYAVLTNKLLQCEVDMKSTWNLYLFASLIICTMQYKFSVSARVWAEVFSPVPKSKQKKGNLDPVSIGKNYSSSYMTFHSTGVHQRTKPNKANINENKGKGNWYSEDKHTFIIDILGTKEYFRDVFFTFGRIQEENFMKLLYNIIKKEWWRRNV